MKKTECHTDELFVGAKMARARINKGISLEQAAKDTRIRVQRLREIESDDFSGFEHPSYARLFLLDYATYLDIPHEQIKPMLPKTTMPATEGLQYLNVLGSKPGESPEELRPTARTGPLLSPFFKIAALLVTLVILVSAALSVLSTINKIERLRPSLPAEEAPAPPTPTPTVSPALNDAAETFDAVIEQETVETFEPVAAPSPSPVS